MNLRNQVCTLEQAKQLAALGIVQQRAHAHWLTDAKGINYLATATNNAFVLYHEDGSRGTASAAVLPGGWVASDAAFTASELGVMLHPWQDWSHTPDGWHYGTQHAVGYIRLHNVKNEAQVRAVILICQLENGITTAAEVNRRLLLNP